MGKKLIIKGANFSQNAVEQEPVELVSELSHGKYFDTNGNLQSQDNWDYCSINVSQLVGVTIYLKPILNDELSAVCGWKDASNVYHPLYATVPYDYPTPGADDLIWIVPDNAITLCLCCQTNYSCYPPSAVYYE